MLVPNDEILRHLFAGGISQQAVRIGSWRLGARSPGQIENPMRTCTYVLSCTIGGVLCRKALWRLLRLPFENRHWEEGAN